MSEWKEYKLGDCIEAIIDNRGKSAPTNEIGGFPLMEINCIGGYYPNYSAIRKYVDENTYKNWFRSGHPVSGDILIPTVGTIGIISMMDNTKACIAQNLIALRIKKDISNVFIYYYLKNPRIKKELLNLDIGGVQPSIKVPHLLNLSIYLPPREVQTKIASILSSLDDKIDLLNRENATLEAMAKTLFRQWFIEDAKEDWEEGKLGDLIEVKYGKDHKKLQDGNIPVFGSGGIMRYADTALYDKESVLIPRKGTLNNVMYINEPFWTVDTMFYTEMRRPNITKFIYHFMKEQDLVNMNVGSAVPSMTIEVLNNIPLDIPPQELFDKYEESVSALYSKQQQNRTQIKTLSKQRDILLPKLMSNEIQL